MSIFGADGLNFSVRNGKRCYPNAIVTKTVFTSLGIKNIKLSK